MIIERLEKIKSIIECPDCHGDIQWLEANVLCCNCQKNFPIEAGVLIFYKPDIESTSESKFQAEQMFDNTFTAKLFNYGRRLISSEYVPKNQLHEFLKKASQLHEFLKKASPDDIILELGSGNRRLREDIINLDIFSFPNVDIVADASKTPFKNNAIDFVVLDTVLEHVPEPHKLVKEILRILKPGGECICIVPFVFPYHGYPAHYFNISKDGLKFFVQRFFRL